MNNIKNTIAKNLTILRQSKSLTQNELAKIFNYSDKSVSKWEHGDTTPPIDVLYELANFYDITLDYLVSAEINQDFDNKYNISENKRNKIIITSLSVSIVWIFATVMFVYGSLINQTENLWKVYIYSLPASVIILLVFNTIWGKRKYTFILISMLIWTLLISFYIYNLNINPWPIFIVGVPLQIADVLWSKMIPNKNKKKK